MPQPRSKLEPVVVKKRQYSIKGTEIEADKRFQTYHRAKEKYIDPATRRWQEEQYPRKAQTLVQPTKAPKKVMLSPAQQKAAMKGEPLPMQAKDIKYIYKHSGSDAENVLASIEEYNTTVLPIKVKKRKDAYYPYVLEGRKHKEITPEGSFGFSTEEKARDAGMRHLGYNKQEIGAFKSMSKGGIDPNAPIELPRRVRTRKRASEQSRVAKWQRTASFRLDKKNNKYKLKFKETPPLEVRQSLKDEGKYDKKTNTWTVPNTPLYKNWLSTNFGAEKRPIGYLKPDEAMALSKARKEPVSFIRKRKEREVKIKRAKRVIKERRIRYNTRWYYRKKGKRKWKQVYRDSETGQSQILEKWKRTGDTEGLILAEVSNPSTVKMDKEKIRNNDPSVKFHT